MDNRNIFASNLKKYMRLRGKSRTDISEALGISYFTVSDWVNGKKYPRMDKVELLANYFGIQKSDLIEDKKENPPEERELSEGEKMFKELEALFMKLPEESQRMYLEVIRAALKKHK